MIGLLSFPTGEETELYIEMTDQMVSKEHRDETLHPVCMNLLRISVVYAC